MVRLISTVLVIALTCGVRGASRSDESITRLTQVYEEYGRSGEPVRSIGAIQMVPKAEPIERTVRLVFDMPKGLPLPTGQLFIQYWSLVSDSARSSPRIIGAEVNGTTTEFTITARSHSLCALH
jgi:hypothetical protein